MSSKFTRDELSGMSVIHLRNLNIENREEELLVQEILDLKLASQPMQSSVQVDPTATDPHRRNSEQIKELQKEIDAKNAKLRGKAKKEDVIEEVTEAPVEAPEQIPVEVDKVAPKKGKKK